MTNEAHRLIVMAELAHKEDSGACHTIVFVVGHLLNCARLDHVLVNNAFFMENPLTLSFADVNLFSRLADSVFCQVVLDE